MASSKDQDHLYSRRRKDQDHLYNCTECKKGFSKRWRLKLHLQNHPYLTFADYICPLCDAKFAFASMFRNHLLLCHSVPNMERPFKCKMKTSVCKKTFSRTSCLQAHKIVHHGVKSLYMCRKCPKICCTKGHLRRHYKYHLTPKASRFKCIICGKRFHTNRCLQWHRYFHNFPRNKYIECKYCERGFSSADLAEMHMFTQHTHSDKQTFVCPLCGKHYQNRKVMLSHSAKCTLGMECSTCGKTDFPNRSTFMIHEKNHIKVVCKVCGKSYGKDALKTHRKRCRSEAEKSLCPICGIKVVMLPSHIRRVHEDRKFPCMKCNRVYIQKYHLQEHMETHSENRERKFVCDICGKAFYNKRSLVHHSEVHEKKKNTCEYCGKVLYTQVGLKCHIRLHTGEKRFKCSVCSKAFPTSSGLKYHEKRGKCLKLCDSSTVLHHQGSYSH